MRHLLLYGWDSNNTLIFFITYVTFHESSVNFTTENNIFISCLNTDNIYGHNPRSYVTVCPFGCKDGFVLAVRVLLHRYFYSLQDQFTLLTLHDSLLRPLQGVDRSHRCLPNGIDHRSLKSGSPSLPQYFHLSTLLSGSVTPSNPLGFLVSYKQ